LRQDKVDVFAGFVAGVAVRLPAGFKRREIMPNARRLCEPPARAKAVRYP